MPTATERDEYFIRERVNFELTLLRADGSFPDTELPSTVVTLTLKPPPDDDGNDRDDIDLSVVGTPGQNFFVSTYDTEWSGWHEWRMETTGGLVGAQQGRFRVVPINV